jgi:hypothetical protein
VIAVPVFPPDPRRLRKDLDHFASIQQSSGALVALTHATYNYAKKVSDIKKVFSSSTQPWPQVTWLVIDSVLSSAKANLATDGLPLPQPTDVAFLQ